MAATALACFQELEETEGGSEQGAVRVGAILD